jgi:protein SCO1/2
MPQLFGAFPMNYCKRVPEEAKRLMGKSKLLLCFGLAIFLGAGQSMAGQGQTSADVGVDEKPGAQVALDQVLKDEEGKDVTLRQLIDKPTILTLNYFRCSGICTPLLNGMADMINRIESEPGKDFQVITVSFDPRDTPEIARQKQISYLKLMNRPVTPAAWRFLTGSAQDTKQVADSAGFHFRADGDQFLHAGAVIVLTPEGVVSRYLYGITFLPADVQMAIQEAATGKVRPSISRFLAFCYNYDPKSRQYVLDITRVLGAVILVCIGGFVVYLLRGRSRGNKDKSRYQA